MNLYQILLPRTTNDGSDYQAQHSRWKRFALETVGAFTQANAVQGLWQDAGQTYGDIAVPYYVACTPEQWRLLVEKAFDLFEDQKAIFHAMIGDATIEFRPANKVAA